MKDITHIQLRISAGSTVTEAIEEAIRKTSEAEIVTFDFNGIKFAVTDKTTKEEMMNYWSLASMAEKWYTRY